MLQAVLTTAVARRQRGARSGSLQSMSVNPNRNPRAAKRHETMMQGGADREQG